MDKVKNAPVLRFPEFIDQWTNKKLGEIGDFKNGLNKGKKDFGFGIPFVNLMDVFGKQILKESNFGLVNASVKEQNTYNLIKGDVLFIRSSVKRTGVGQTILITKDYSNTVYSGFLIRFRLFYKMELLYKRYCFSVQSFRKELLSYATSSANTNINQESLEKIIVSFPKPKEQLKIAEFLSEVDKKIELLTKKKRGLENYKKGIMQKIFNQEIRFKDDNGNDYPDWEEITLGNVGNIITGSTPATKIKEYYNGNKLFVSPADIEKSRYISETKTTLTTLGFSKGRLVKQNSVLFVCIGSTIGKLIQVTEDCITNQQINSIITFDKFSSDFLYSLLEFNAIKIKNLAGVQAVPMINKTTFSKIKLNFPSFDEQVGIANYLIEFDNKINQLERQLSNIKRYKKGLLQQMFV